MNTLGTKNKNKGQLNPGEENLPLFLKGNTEEVSFGKSLIISTIAHPAIVILLWLLFQALLLLLAFLGVTLPIFQKPQPQMKDIQFVLVNRPEQTPINKHTPFRSDRNTRAGGKHDPKKQISPPEAMATKSAPQKASPTSKPSPQRMQKPAKSSPQHHQAQHQENTPIPPRPRATNSYPKPRISHRTPFSVPVPRTRSIGPMSPRGGPVTSAPTSSSSSSEPSPMMSSGGYSRGHRSHAYSAGGGNAGNPGPGNPHGAPGIDALKEPDFGAYMSELQRRIKRNWNPPRGDNSKRVVMLFKISRDGRLLSIHIKQSSGSPEADAAAKSAVELSAPFRPLPPEFRGSNIDIDFTFDYNVLNAIRLR